MTSADTTPSTFLTYTSWCHERGLTTMRDADFTCELLFVLDKVSNRVHGCSDEEVTAVLNKMTAALGIAPSKAHVFLLDGEADHLPAPLKAKRCCVMGESAKDLLKKAQKNLTWSPPDLTCFTYHPAEFLRNQALKKQVWQDLQPLRLKSEGV